VGGSHALALRERVMAQRLAFLRRNLRKTPSACTEIAE
jgi:hypothetical protein